MGWLLKFLKSSIGKKFMMALTGSFLLIFLIVHLIGNITCILVQMHLTDMLKLWI